MIWANSLILGLGGALLAIPILLHLLMQPKPKRIIFPAMRFLQEKHQTTRTRMRLRHFLLLLIRCLLIGFLVLALAGPTVASREFGNWLTFGGVGLSGSLIALILAVAWINNRQNRLLIGVLAALLLGHLILAGWFGYKLLNAEPSDLFGNDQTPIAALVVIDSSPRMDFKHENKTRFELAKEKADWLIRQFPVDSQICIATNDGDKPFYSVDVSAALKRTEKLEINFLSDAIPSALQQGFDLISKAPQERKEMYVVTDLTKQSWVGDNWNPLLRKLEANPEISLFVIDVGIENPKNFSLGQLNLTGASLAENGQFSVNTLLSQTGEPTQRTVRMRLEKPDPTRPVLRDGETLVPDQFLEEQTQTLDLPQDGSRAASFVSTSKLTKGTYHGKIEIEGKDGLGFDDARYFTVRVQDPWRVLVVHPTGVSPKNLVSTIAPSVPGQTRRSSYDCQAMLQEKFSDLDNLSNFDAIFLLNPMPLADPLWNKLRNYVSQGGSLGVMLGHNASRGGAADPSFQTPMAQEMLTGKLDLIWDTENTDWTLRPQSLSHPMFKILRRYEEGILWNRVSVFRHWGLESGDVDKEQVQHPTEVLMKYTNGEPALIERMIGRGRILVMTTPISERAREEGRKVWNELYNFPTFVPWLLIQMITEYLVEQDSDSLNIAVGQIATFQNDLSVFPESYQVFFPKSGKPTVPLNANDSTIKFRFTTEPGHFRIKGAMDGQPLLRGFSANLPESSTNLTRILPAELDEILGAGRYRLAREAEEIQREQGTARRGQEFYSLLILMMLVLFAMEYLMSNRFYASR